MKLNRQFMGLCLVILLSTECYAEKILVKDGASYMGWQISPTQFKTCLHNIITIGKGMLKDTDEECGVQDGSSHAPVPCPCPAPEPAPVKVCIPLHIEFQIGSAEIMSLYDLDIEKVANFMNMHPETCAVFEGHTDNVETVKNNLELSRERAERVVDRLVVKYGIESSRLDAKGYGMSLPIADNSTEEGKQKNRRIEAFIDCALEKHFVPPPDKLCAPLSIEFDAESSLIKPEYYAQIKKLAEFMKQYPDTAAEVRGHTDDNERYGKNIELSQQRAETVMKHIIEQYGIDKSRLSAKGYGDSRPLAYNTTLEGKKKNRRVEILADCVLIKK